MSTSNVRRSWMLNGHIRKPPLDMCKDSQPPTFLRIYRSETNTSLHAIIVALRRSKFMYQLSHSTRKVIVSALFSHTLL